MALLLLVLAAIVIYYFFIYRENGKLKLFSTGGKRCPNCKNPIEDSYNVCPVCKETLKRKCVNCGQRVDISWKYCPFCENLIDKSEVK